MIPARKTFAIASWNCSDGGTSAKSVSQALRRIADEESGLVTTTSESVPGSRAGVKAVRRDPFPTSGAVAAAPPISTPASFWKRAPLIVTLVPPAAGPEAGLIPVTAKPGSTTPANAIESMLAPVTPVNVSRSCLTVPIQPLLLEKSNV